MCCVFTIRIIHKNARHQNTASHNKNEQYTIYSNDNILSSREPQAQLLPVAIKNITITIIYAITAMHTSRMYIVTVNCLL